MKKSPRSSSLTAPQLKALLRELREDVAAPAGFKALVMRRLEQEGIIAATATPQVARGFGQALRELGLSLPKAWGLGLGAACALALALVSQRESVVEPLQVAAPQAHEASEAVPVGQANRSLRAHRPVVQVASHKAAASAVLAAAPSIKAEPIVASAPIGIEETVEQVVSVPVQHTEPVPALGAYQAQAVAASAHVASLAAPDASQAPAATVSAAPVAAAGESSHPYVPVDSDKPLRGISELRNNVIRASKGGSARLIFRMDAEAMVKVDVYDRLGVVVAQLHQGALGAGTHELLWDGRGGDGNLLASGIYEMRLQGLGVAVRHKVMLIK